jgi:hypothetical protein
LVISLYEIPHAFDRFVASRAVAFAFSWRSSRRRFAALTIAISGALNDELMRGTHKHAPLSYFRSHGVSPHLEQMTTPLSGIGSRPSGTAPMVFFSRSVVHAKQMSATIPVSLYLTKAGGLAVMIGPQSKRVNPFV